MEHAGRYAIYLNYIYIVLSSIFTEFSKQSNDVVNVAEEELSVSELLERANSKLSEYELLQS